MWVLQYVSLDKPLIGSRKRCRNHQRHRMLLDFNCGESRTALKEITETTLKNSCAHALEKCVITSFLPSLQQGNMLETALRIINYYTNLFTLLQITQWYFECHASLVCFSICLLILYGLPYYDSKLSCILLLHTLKCVCV